MPPSPSPIPHAPLRFSDGETKRTLTDICRDGWAWQRPVDGLPTISMTTGGTLLLAGGGRPCASAQTLGHATRARPQQSITLVNRCSTALYSGMVPGLIAGLYQRDELAIDLRQLCERAGVAFVEAEITGLDTEQNCLHLRDRLALHFDWLSLDVGAVSRPSSAGSLSNRWKPRSPSSKTKTQATPGHCGWSGPELPAWKWSWPCAVAGHNASSSCNSAGDS